MRSSTATSSTTVARSNQSVACVTFRSRRINRDSPLRLAHRRPGCKWRSGSLRTRVSIRLSAIHRPKRRLCRECQFRSGLESAESVRHCGARTSVGLRRWPRYTRHIRHHSRRGIRCESTPGNNLIITSGETQGSGTANGGYLLLIGGGSFAGTGGTATCQGGTSANGTGGPAILAGGNATNGGIPGDAYVIGGAGQAPGQGANVHLIMTEVNDISGVVRIRVNSTPLIDFYHDGSIYLYDGNGFGTAGQHLTSQGPGMPVIWS